MYNYLEDKNLNEVYNYLKANNMYDTFIKDIVEENKDYEKMLKNATLFNKMQKKGKNKAKKEAVERNEK